MQRIKNNFINFLTNDKTFIEWGFLMWPIIVLIAVAVAVLGGITAMLVITVPIAKRVYNNNLVRTEPEKWGRVCSFPDNEEQVAMWNQGIEWSKKHQDKMTEVEIQSEGFRLVGEYYDFGHKRAVIIFPGRCESLIYSYYFAEGYENTDSNILVVDTRAHGKSEGKYNTIGGSEKQDVKEWCRFLHDNYGIEEIYFHGICIGSAAAILAMADEDCPEYVKGLVTEGCFTTFRETFKRHMIADKRPLFPVLDMVMFLIYKHTGTNVIAQSPIKKFKKINQRVLFIFGTNDIFSIPPKSQKLFDICASKDKTLVWLTKGSHSHLRINNTEEYDNAIKEFITK